MKKKGGEKGNDIVGAHERRHGLKGPCGHLLSLQRSALSILHLVHLLTNFALFFCVAFATAQHESHLLFMFIIYFFLQNVRPLGQVFVLVAQVSPALSAGLNLCSVDGCLLRSSSRSWET